MASYDAHKNFAYCTVATAPAPAASGTSLIVSAGDGVKFPAVPFNATIWPINTQPTTLNAEIVRVTNITTDTFTITRAQESSAARTVLVGDQIAATITVKTLTDVEVSTGLDQTSPIVRTSIITPASGGIGYGVCGGRLTLTTAVPVTTADVTGATSVFFTPYDQYGAAIGNIGLYDGSANWTILPFAEISVALGTLTSGLPYDIFAYNNGGTVALRAPVAWTSTSARATALVLQNGVLVKTGATTDRYLGTFFTTSTTQTEDSALNRYLWNYYNRVPRDLYRIESTASWTYQTATVRQANGSASNQVSVVVGVAEVTLDLSLNLAANNSGSNVISFGIGEDSTTTYAAGTSAVAASSVPMSARLVKMPAIGKHTYSWNEWSTAAGTTTWNGATAAVGSSVTAGLTGMIDG